LYIFTVNEEQSMEIDVERQQKAHNYARTRRMLSFVDLGIATAGLLIVFVAGLDKWLRNVIQGITFLRWQPLQGWYPLQIVLYFLIAILVYQVITAPLAYYSGFVLPHRYGISTMTFQAWLQDLVKGLGLGLILEFAAITLIYALLLSNYGKSRTDPAFSPLLQVCATARRRIDATSAGIDTTRQHKSARHLLHANE
jgi:hypothetical protein